MYKIYSCAYSQIFPKLPFKCIKKNHDFFFSLSITAQKCSSKCTERNLAHLQAYEVSEAGQSRTSSSPSEEISVGNLCVSKKLQYFNISI